jgi:outer membrane protein
MKSLLALAGAAVAALPIAEAHAQVIQTIRVRPGVGAQIKPKFMGAKETEWAVYPTFSIAFGDEPFGVGAPDDSLSFKLLGEDDGFSAGPAAAIEGKRKESDVGAPVGTVDTTVEAGAFAQARFGAFRVRAEGRKGIGGHKGAVGHLAADYILHEGDRYAFTLGPRLLFSDARYQRAYFGVSPEVALATGLEPYSPGGGLHAVAGAAGMRYSLGGPWGLFGYARYERLVGDAKRSPIIREYGSPNQYSAGLGVSHTFTLRL